MFHVLCTNLLDDDKIRAGRLGAIEAIINILHRHINNAEVCKEGCCALNYIIIDRKFIIYYY